MTEKIIISKELNEWLEDHPKLDTDNTPYSERFGKEIFNELFEVVWSKISYMKSFQDLLDNLKDIALSYSNSKTAHLWLLLNRDKWEVKEDELFYICIPEVDGIDVYFIKVGGFQCSSKPPQKEYYKWTQEEIDKHEIAKHLQQFKKKVEK